MLIAPNLYQVLLWTGIGIAVVAVFVWGAYADIEVQRKRLPAAVVAKKKSRGRALLRWLPVPTMLLGLGFSVFVWFSTDVVVVTEDADGPTGMRWKWIGGGLPYRTDSWVRHDPTWIVNHTRRTLLVYHVGTALAPRPPRWGGRPRGSRRARSTRPHRSTTSVPTTNRRTRSRCRRTSGSPTTASHPPPTACG